MLRRRGDEMKQLWIEFSKESRTNWFNSLALFIASSLWLIYYLGIQGNTITRLPEIVMILLVLFACLHFLTELLRQIKVFKKSYYRLLPLSERRLYLYNIVFGWVTSSSFVLLYYAGYALITLLLNHTENAGIILNYGKYLFFIIYSLLTLTIYSLFIYFLSFMISLKVKLRFQRITRYLLVFLFIVMEGVVSSYLMQTLQQIKFFQIQGLKITLYYTQYYLSDFLLDGCLIIISVVITVVILKKYIEPERR
jgi:hypothetical protein